MNNRQMLKTSQLKPNISKNVMRDLRGLNRTSMNQGMEFERYIEGLFVNLNWEVLTTPNSGDYGVDLVVQSLDGKVLVIQAKDENKSLGVQAIQEIVTGAIFYEKEPRLQGKQITHKIVIASGHGLTDDLNSLYTANAKELAARTGTILWTPKELQILADAAVFGENLLEPLGFHQLQISQTKKHFGWLWTLGLIPLIFIYLAIPKQTITTVSDLRPNSQTVDAKKNFLASYDAIYRKILGTNDLGLIDSVLVSPEADEVRKSVQGRIAKSCYRETIEEKPMEIQEINSFTNTARVKKYWTQYEVCGQSRQKVVWTPFTAEYKMVFVDSGYKISNTEIK
jgi:HJR/Mrr/RecB family endonuclease